MTRALVALLLVPTLAGCGAGRIEDPELERRLEAVRAATAKYADVEVALRDGFEPPPACIEAEDGSGGIGLQYTHPGRSRDGRIELLAPEQLLYAPGPGGGPPVLVGVEYFVADTGDPPETPFGRMDGPMPGHVPGQPRHYELHAWVHRANPNGVFDVWNPDVDCAAP